MTHYQKNHPESIQAMFGSIASTYDRTNAVLSFRMHHRWNSALVKEIIAAGNPEILLDLCAGTGEIAFKFAQHVEQPIDIHLLDFCSEMLQCARAKSQHIPNAEKHKISFIQGDAQALPLPNNLFSCATVAYGIRNIPDPLKCFKEVYRVLENGGTFGILELTRPTNPLLCLGHRVYLRTVLPVLGWFFSANQEAYKYLCNSIHTFVKSDELASMLAHAGFKDIKRIPLSGGIATILIAKKKA